MAPTILRYPIENISNGTAQNKLVGLMQMTSKPFAENTLFDYLPGLLIILSVYFIVFLSLKLRGFSFLACFATANIVNFVLVLLMYPIGILSGQVFVISLFLVPISMLLLFIFS